MFSNDSRWDRHLPHQSHQEQRIDVGAVFRNGQIFPKCFIWKNRKYRIHEITYHWKEKRGSEVLYYFSVTDSTNLYQIFLNNRYMEWRLSKVCPI